mmetsp:Transcript_22419/g.27037  ORF Transcript_22419/g.27037 Transcript_22419/m.27037 type:complete len:205 (+) Transcript_22419:86-700(+)
MLTALLVKAALPLPDTPSGYVLPILLGVTVQELLRPITYKGYRISLDQLNGVADNMGFPSLSVLDKFMLTLAIGFGHGLSHLVFFFLSILPASMGQGTYYVDTCPQMSIFLYYALTGLCFLIIHTSSMVVAYTAYSKEDRKLLNWIQVPLLHYTASLLTLLNFMQGGCVYVIPALAVLSAAVMTHGLFIFVRMKGHAFSVSTRI